MHHQQHGPLCVATFVDASPFQENTYLLWPTGETDAWIIDPGFPPAPEGVIATVDKHHLVPSAIILTHGHSDHIAGVADLRRVYADIPICIPRAEAHFLTDAEANLSAPFGMPIVAPPADRQLEPGTLLTLGGLSFELRDVAGHSPGGIALYCEAAGVTIVGDALFAGGIGRTDFPGSSLDQLLANIAQNLLTLPGETVVYPGHGPATTIATERTENPFVRRDLE
jgi:hydroxyacylglutathione hydrolase